MAQWCRLVGGEGLLLARLPQYPPTATSFLPATITTRIDRLFRFTHKHTLGHTFYFLVTYRNGTYGALSRSYFARQLEIRVAIGHPEGLHDYALRCVPSHQGASQHRWG